MICIARRRRRDDDIQLEGVSPDRDHHPVFSFHRVRCRMGQSAHAVGALRRRSDGAPQHDGDGGKEYTKGDLVAYYRAVAPWILPYLKDRPVVLTRFPDGIHGKSFFQKDAPEWSPSWRRGTESSLREPQGRHH